MPRCITALRLAAFTAAALTAGAAAQACIHPPVDDKLTLEKSEQDSFALSLVGLKLAEAGAKAESKGRQFRVVKKDGEALFVTEDYVPGRINAEIADGVVVGVTVEGQSAS